MDVECGSRGRPIYREAFGQVREGIVSVDADLEVSACNSVALEILRTNGSDPLGRSLWNLFPDAVGTIAQAKIESALNTDRQQSFERYDPRSRTWFEVRVYPDGDGLSLFFRKISDGGARPRNLRPAEEPTGVGGWKIDLPSETLYVSEEVLRIRGLPPDYDLTLEEGLQFYHPEDRPVLEAAVERLKTTGETYDLELREVTDDGEIYWVRTTGVAEYDEDGTITALRGVYRDITERKESELALARKTREVERQNERLDDFANVVSHDLRNPLNVAMGRLQLARERIESDHFDAIGEALSRMDTLIRDVLDLARHGREVTDLEAVDLATVVEQCWEAVGSADARLVIRDEPTIRCDGGRLRQLLGNLLRNAIENGGEAVTVVVGALDDGFYVEDDGPGIPRTQRDRVFQSGYSTTETGTGFGLAIVREIADAHHWHVRISESADGGARFEFTRVDRP